MNQPEFTPPIDDRLRAALSNLGQVFSIDPRYDTVILSMPVAAPVPMRWTVIVHLSLS